jgi:murein endopeptidase
MPVRSPTSPSIPTSPRRRPGGRLTRRGRFLLVAVTIGLVGLVLPTSSRGLTDPGFPAVPAAEAPRPTAAAARHLAELRQAEADIRWRRSRAVGKPNRGRLEAAVQLPAEGVHFVTWDPALDTTPNRGWRRNGTDRLVRLVLRVAAEYAAAHPGAQRIVVGDLSRPAGGEFGRRYGGGGHASHQNGLDVDVYYPRADGREVAPTRPGQVDRALAQDLVDRFVGAGVQHVFVGKGVRLHGPPKVVGLWPHHDDHMHVRIRP